MVDTNTSEKTVPPRCEHGTCRKKLTLASFACKCKKYYCVTHKPERVHECTFDYRDEQKQHLNKYLSTAVIAKKVEAI